jgi:hypothetical protein
VGAPLESDYVSCPPETKSRGKGGCVVSRRGLLLEINTIPLPPERGYGGRIPSEEKDSKKIYNILKKSGDLIPYGESSITDQQSKLSVIGKIQENMISKVKKNKRLPTFRNFTSIRRIFRY